MTGANFKSWEAQEWEGLPNLHQVMKVGSAPDPLSWGLGIHARTLGASASLLVTAARQACWKVAKHVLVKLAAEEQVTP